MIGNSAALDTNQAIAILNDVPAALAFYRGFAELTLPVVVLGELRFGALNSAKVAENLTKIDRLLARCRLLVTSDRTASVYAELRMALKRAATPIPQNDLWIAAAAVEHALPIVTADAHFKVVPKLIIIPPPVP
jgi:tRNA(fMet)-specific endonuclease VapC